MSVTCFFGKTGSGKTFRAKEQIKNKKRKIIFDAAFCFSGSNAIRDYSPKNLKRLLRDYAKSESYELIFRPIGALGMTASAEMVAKFAKALGRANQAHARIFKKGNEAENVAVVFDELNKYIIDSNRSQIKICVEMGRHYGLDIFAISQVPATLPKFIRDNALEMYCFKLGPNDFYKSFFGKELSEKLKKFEKYHFLKWHDEHGISCHDAKGALLWTTQD